MMLEKVVYYTKLLELMMNPANASPIFLMLLREITSEDKKVIDSVLSSFVELELAAHRLDVQSKEKEEADFILKTFKTWNDKKEDVDFLIKVLERNWKQVKNSQKKERNYFN